MFGQITILIIIFVILAVFYLVISLGATGNKKKTDQSKDIRNYLNNVRVLIIMIGIVFLILWFFFKS